MIENSASDVGVMPGFGPLGYLMESNRFPIVPTIPGVVPGGMLEQSFVISMI